MSATSSFRCRTGDSAGICRSTTRRPKSSRVESALARKTLPGVHSGPIRGLHGAVKVLPPRRANRGSNLDRTFATFRPTGAKTAPGLVSELTSEPSTALGTAATIAVRRTEFSKLGETEMRFARWLCWLLLLAGALVYRLDSAAAQGSDAERQACTPDAMKLCGDFIPDVEKITACMHAKRSQLSEPCRVAMRGGGKEGGGRHRGHREHRERHHRAAHGSH
jgi:hypothetical protein